MIRSSVRLCGGELPPRRSSFLSVGRRAVRLAVQEISNEREENLYFFGGGGGRTTTHERGCECLLGSLTDRRGRGESPSRGSGVRVSGMVALPCPQRRGLGVKAAPHPPTVLAGRGGGRRGLCRGEEGRSRPAGAACGGGLLAGIE